MDDFSAGDLRQLMEKQPGLCVSVLLPTHVAGQQAQQDPVRLKNLLNRAEEMLTAAGMRGPQARDLLHPVRLLPENADFWERRGCGLAVFVSEGATHCYRVPLDFAEAVVVNRRFFVKPMLPLLGMRRRYLVLALSQNRVRVVDVDGQSMRELSVPGMPENLKEALNISSVDAGQQVHSGMRGSLGKQAAVFHGQGGQRDTAKSDIAQFFRIVDAALSDSLQKARPPLILAGVDYLLPIYRQVTGYANVAEEEVTGNFDYANDLQLRERSEPIAERIFRRERDRAAAHYRKLAGTGKATDDVSQIVPAAHEGRVDTLFLDWRSSQPGTFDAASRKVTVCSEVTAETDDLVDMAAAATLDGRGTVYAVERAEMPTGAPLAALFRY